MKNIKTSLFSLLLMILFSAGIAEEKKIKLRGISNNNTLKPIQISISPDLLEIDKIKDLKSTYEAAKEFANKTDKQLKIRKVKKFRSGKASESPSKIYDDYAKSVFFLYNEKAESIGTGFLVDSSGLILSNWHVTDKTKKMFVWTLPEEGVIDADSLFAKEYYFGSVIAENKKEDLALIKAIGLPKNIKPMQVPTEKELKQFPELTTKQVVPGHVARYWDLMALADNCPVNVIGQNGLLIDRPGFEVDFLTDGSSQKTDETTKQHTVLMPMRGHWKLSWENGDAVINPGDTAAIPPNLKHKIFPSMTGEASLYRIRNTADPAGPTWKKH